MLDICRLWLVFSAHGKSVISHGKRHFGLHNALENSPNRARELIEVIGKTDRRHDCIFCIIKEEGIYINCFSANKLP